MGTDLPFIIVAADISGAFRPPLWRLLSWIEWKRHYQPFDVARAMLAAQCGEFEPVQRYGINISVRDVSGDATGLSDRVTQEIYRQASRLGSNA